MKYFIGLFVIVLGVSANSTGTAKTKVVEKPSLELSFKEAVTKPAPELSTQKNYLFKDDTTRNALIIFPAQKIPSITANNSTKIEFILEDTPQFVKDYTIQETPPDHQPIIPKKVYLSRISDKCLYYFSGGYPDLVATSVTVDPGANFDFSGHPSFFEKETTSFFAQHVRITRTGTSLQIGAELVCDGKTDIGKANKIISAKFKGWDWAKSFLYFQPKEQNVEDTQQRSADPVQIQRGTASVPQ